MKRLFFGLLVAIIAIGGSAFATFNKAANGDFLVQLSLGHFVERGSVPGTCNITSNYYCIYEFTQLGIINIPVKPSYDAYEISTYLAKGWLEQPAGDVRRLYEE